MTHPTTSASSQIARVSSHVLPPTDVPDDFEKMWHFAEKLSEATEFIPETLRGKPGNVLALMLRARALNIPLATAWDELYINRGRVGQKAKLVRALMRRAGHRIAYPEADQFHATALVQLAGEKSFRQVSFTIREAQIQGLTDPEGNNKGGQWDRMPKQMLVARVTTRAANWFCPEVLLGLGGEDEDVEDVEIDSDVIQAHQEEQREKVKEVLKAVEDLERETDGEARLTALRELFFTARQKAVLDFAVDDTGARSVRQVITEKLYAADQLKKEQADRQTAPASDEAEAPPEGNGKATAKTATKKAARKTSASKKAQGAATQPSAPPAEPSSDGHRLPCRCVADYVMQTGSHARNCQGSNP